MTKKSRCFFYTHFQEVVILEIYLDVLFLENFLIDYMLLLLTGKILQKQKKVTGMLVSAMLAGAYTVLCQVLRIAPGSGNGVPVQALLQLGNLLIAYAMVKGSYADVRGKQAALCLVTMLILAFVTEGVMAWGEQMFEGMRTYRSTVLMAIGTIWFGYLFLQRWVRGLRDRMFFRKCNLPVVLRVGGRQIGCRGLMDSGNSLYEPITHRPVVIVEKELLLRHGIEEPETYFAIPYHAIGTQNGILKGVLADELEIPGQQGEKRWQKVMLGIYEGKISRQDEYQVILHPKL